MSEKKIGRYEIKRELGRGGMATVYLAYDPVLEREVALKLLPNYFAHEPEFTARFEREAKTVSALEHSSIVPMYDYGSDGGWPYLVMRLMKDGSLKGRIAQGQLSLEEADHIIGRIAKALDKAHSLGIVHRDLKPGNILFDEDEAFLSDFGIVKLAEGSSGYTQTGKTLGTPAYMSPEQGDGRIAIDGRSDVYALGIILYEMLSGTAPYVHDSTPWLLVMHLTHPIPNILEIRSDLPPSIQSIIEKAMAKKPEERYQTAGALAADLRAVVWGEKTAVPPVAQPKPKPKQEEDPLSTIETKPGQMPGRLAADQPVSTAVSHAEPDAAVQPVGQRITTSDTTAPAALSSNSAQLRVMSWKRVGVMLLAVILYIFLAYYIYYRVYDLLFMLISWLPLLLFGLSGSEVNMGTELRSNWSVLLVLVLLSSAVGLALGILAYYLFYVEHTWSWFVIYGSQLGVFFAGLRKTREWRKKRIRKKIVHT